MIQTIKRIAKRAIPRHLGIWELRRAAGNSVLLTFDDGPHPTTTPAVLDRLRQYQARAMFFVVGDRIERAPELLARIVQEGHLLGNHTFSHPLNRWMGRAEYYNDLLRCQDEIYRLTNLRPRFHRPPMGQLSIASVLAPRQLGLTTLFWSCSSEDWRFRTDETALVRAEELALSVKARDIVLFHDERPHTITALDRLLPALRSRGLNLSPQWEHIQ